MKKVHLSRELIRQYIPKKANFDDFSERQIKEIPHKINRMHLRKLKVLCT
ncbi:MAG: hypothetical protein LBB79_05905 [Prevotellaceae bacterium]|nr:hypothetical protein [Prevotellaceae bacterium]